MSDQYRPVLGAETEVSLAKMNLAAGSGIIGDYELITCTRQIEFAAPTIGSKPIACGYTRSAQVIPTAGDPGSLSFEGLDKAKDNRAMYYHGEVCAAKLVSKVDGVVVRTIYCWWYKPDITIRAPDSDNEGTVSGSGQFSTTT